MAEFLMPKLGADMEAGLLVAWKKCPGDAVRRGDIVAVVETDKGTIDVECFATGVWERTLVQPGERVPVGTPLAMIRDASDEASTTASSAAISSKATTPSDPALPVAKLPTAVASIDLTRIRISPSARRLARELGVDPSSLVVTGPGRAITREDIERAALAKSAPVVPTVEPAAETKAPSDASDRFSKMRQTIAAAMSRSKREIPHYYLSTTINFQPALAWLADQNAQRPVTERLLYGVLLLKATALALREVPELNAIWDNDRAVAQPSAHLGVAIALRQGGLIAPAIHGVEQQSLERLMAQFRDLVNRARSGGLRSSELSDATITVTNLGENGVESVFGVIYPPQVAIVGFGKIVERPWVVNGQVVPRSVITAALSADHRVTDGHRGALFLAALDRLLQEPNKL